MFMKTKIFILYAIMSLCWGLTWYFLKISLRTMPMYWGLSLRFLIAGAIFWGLYYYKSERIVLTSKLRSVYIMFALFNFTIGYFLTYWATQYIYSNLGAILWSLFPISVAGMAHLFLPDDRMNLRKSFSMAVGLAGTILLLYNGESLGEGKVFMGIMAILIAVFLAAWPNVYMKMGNHKMNAYHLNAVGMTISGIIMLIASLIVEQGQTMPTDPENLFALFFLTVPGTVVTWGIYIWLFNHLRVSQLSYVAFFPPVVAILMGWLFLGESLPWVTLAGAGLVIMGGFLINYNPQEPTAVEP